MKTRIRVVPLSVTAKNVVLMDAEASVVSANTETPAMMKVRAYPSATRSPPARGKYVGRMAAEEHAEIATPVSHAVKMDFVMNPLVSPNARTKSADRIYAEVSAEPVRA